MFEEQPLASPGSANYSDVYSVPPVSPQYLLDHLEGVARPGHDDLVLGGGGGHDLLEGGGPHTALQPRRCPPAHPAPPCLNFTQHPGTQLPALGSGWAGEQAGGCSGIDKI